MTPQDWESPVRVDAVEGLPEEAAYAMRPLSTGEVLDRTFAIYRSRFWLFAGIASLSGAVQLVANAFNLLGQHMFLSRYGFHAVATGSSIGTLVGIVLFFLAAAVTQAATVFALSEVYLGRTATVMGSLHVTMRLWYRYVGIAMWQIWSAMWLGLAVALPSMIFLAPRLGLRRLAWLGGVLIFVGVLGGGVYGVIAYLRNSLGIQAAVVEKRGVRASMRRSKELTVGTKGRIFVVLLVAGVLYYVAAALQMPMLFLIAKSPLQPHVAAQAAILTISFVTHTLVSPVALIGMSLVYFDQRVRMEAFDLVMLLGGEMPAVAGGASAEVAAPVAVGFGGIGNAIGDDGRV